MVSESRRALRRPVTRSVGACAIEASRLAIEPPHHEPVLLWPLAAAHGKIRLASHQIAHFVSRINFDEHVRTFGPQACDRFGDLAGEVGARGEANDLAVEAHFAGRNPGELVGAGL